ncbi:MAG: BNR repeat-containing protein [Lachnospiraceae bacterium]|nr:BNR repeat-containing protein [Lachnospiraceae bacterium]
MMRGFIIVLVAVLPLLSSGRINMSYVADGYSATSVNTTIFRGCALTTYEDYQYVAFYDPEGYVTIGRRVHGDDNWELRRSAYKGNVRDAHNGISIGVDGSGVLHVAFDHHGSPLKYCRSISPGSLELGSLEPMTGIDENDVTYPVFHTFPDGSMLFVYRSGYSGGGNMVLNRYDPSERKWHRMHDVLIDGEGERNAYWQMCVDMQGTIHLSWVWRETWMVETNHDLCYAQSRDGGKTWMRSDGTKYELPITASTAELAWGVPQSSELINQTSMAATPDGRPMIATYWRDKEDSVPQFRLVEYDGEKWRMESVGKRHTPFSLSGGGTKMIPVSRPQILSDGSNTYFIFRDVERGSRASIGVRAHGDSVWTMTDLTDYDVDAWEPNVDEKLWRERGIMNVYVQKTSQGDGEKVTSSLPKPIHIIEYSATPF